MSLFLAGFWIPSSLQFGTTFFETGSNLFDSLIAAFICTVFSGIQLCMVRRTIFLHLRLDGDKSRFNCDYIQGLLLTIASAVFAALFIAASLIYCVSFARNILTLRSVSIPGGAPDFRVARSCQGNALDGSLRCLEISISNLRAGRNMEIVFSALAQAILFLTDGLLVIRCYAIFTDKPYVWGIALLSFLGSIGVAVFGIVSLSRADILTGDSAWLAGDGATLPRGFTPTMSIVSSLVVNAVVAVAIVSRIGNSDVYGSAAGLIIESALPPVVFGILASVFATPSVQSQLKVIEFNLIPKMAWLAFTHPS
ncbi:hypothetical protein H1R20_g16461, partial [Candolleomyces eurysporus]